MRKERSLTLDKVAAHFGTTAKHISRLEKGEVDLGSKWIRGFADFYETDVAEILLGRRAANRVPLVGYVGAGMLYYADPRAGPWKAFDTVEAPSSASRGAFAVRVEGDSFLPVFDDGEILIFNSPRGGGIDETKCLGKFCLVGSNNEGPLFGRFGRFHAGFGHYRLSDTKGQYSDYLDLAWAIPVRWTDKGK